MYSGVEKPPYSPARRRIFDSDASGAVGTGADTTAGDSDAWRGHGTG